MKRVIVVCEGQTEQTFVKEVLAPHLWQSSQTQLQHRLIGDPDRQNKGGIGWPKAHSDVLRLLKSDSTAIVTTMFDLYRLPQQFPGWDEAQKLHDPIERALKLEQALVAFTVAESGGKLNPHRFTPYIQVHEFEALLFSDVAQFAKAICEPACEAPLRAVRDSFESPEHIDDGPTTAPSKRIRSVLPRYEKPLMGCIASLEIGLDTMRSQCKHFDAWVCALERIGQTQK